MLPCAAALLVLFGLTACYSTSATKTIETDAWTLTMESVPAENPGSAYEPSGSVAAAEPAPQPVEEDVYPCHELDVAVENLASSITTRMADGEMESVAIVDFVAGNDRGDQFGRYLSAELTNRLFVAGHCEVVERNYLERVMRKNGFTAADIGDVRSVQRLGTLLGVDTVLVGTITDSGMEVRAKGNLLSVETGAAYAAAQERIQKDYQVLALMNGQSLPARAERTRPALAGLPSTTTNPFAQAEPGAEAHEMAAQIREYWNQYRMKDAVRVARAAVNDPAFEKYANASDWGWVSFALTESVWENCGRSSSVDRKFFNESMKMAERALSMDGSDPMALCAFGQVLFRQGRLNEARPQLEKAIRLDPDCNRIPPSFRRTYLGLIRPTRDPAGQPAD